MQFGFFCEVEEFDDEGEVTITNSSLIHIFPKQTNLVHFDLNGKITSARLYLEHETDVIKFRDDD